MVLRLAAALAVLLLPVAGGAAPKGDRGALHGTIRWWEGVENSWREVVVEATWKRPQFPAWENRTAWVRDDADTFCGAEGTIRYRSHWYGPGERATRDELRDPKKLPELRRRLMQRDEEYARPVRFDDDEVELCVAISKEEHRVLGRLRIDRKGGRFVVEQPWWNTFNNSVPQGELSVRELNALGEPMEARPRPSSTNLFSGWFFEKGTLSGGAAGGSGRWEQAGEAPPGEQAEKRIVEWNLSPGAASGPAIELAGCADLAVGGSGTLSARVSPTGGTYRWSTDGAVLELAPLGGAAAITCLAPGHASVRLAYEAPDGRTFEASRKATCFELRGFERAGPLEVPLHDERGRPLAPVVVPLALAPSDAVDVLEFSVAESGVASTESRTGEVRVQGVREGTTSIQPRTKCGPVGPPAAVKVVPCPSEVVERLRREREQARRRAEVAARLISEAISGDDFNRASTDIGWDIAKAGYALVDLMVSVLEPTKNAKALWRAVSTTKTAVGAVLSSADGDMAPAGAMGTSFALDQLAARVGELKAGVDALKAGQKAYKAMETTEKLSQDLGALYGASAVVDEQLEVLSRNLDRVLKLGEPLKTCRAPEAPPAKPSPSREPPAAGSDEGPSAKGGGKKGGGKKAGGKQGKPPAPKTVTAPQEGTAPEPPPDVPPEPPVEPPEPPPRPPQVGLPIACACPREEKVRWTVAGRTMEVATVRLDGIAACGQDLQASVARFGGVLSSVQDALGQVDGIERKGADERREVLTAAKRLLDQADTGIGHFQAETRDLAAGLEKCRAPLQEVGGYAAGDGKAGRRGAGTLRASGVPPQGAARAIILGSDHR